MLSLNLFSNIEIEPQDRNLRGENSEYNPVDLGDWPKWVTGMGALWAFTSIVLSGAAKHKVFWCCSEDAAELWWKSAMVGVGAFSVGIVLFGIEGVSWLFEQWGR